MSKYDHTYNELIKEVVADGVWDKDQNVRTKWADGTPAYTKSIINKQVKVDISEVPILTTKKVAWKTAIKELLWIWQQKDNNVDNLNKAGVKIWDEWKQGDSTIGKAYGYQMAKKVRNVPDDTKIDQVDYLLYSLKHNPSSRRHVTTLWNIDDLDEMALQPCVWNTHWQVLGGNLHLTVGVRSNDIGLGHPFNVFQYYINLRMIAQVTGYEPGSLTFNIDNVHAYERHLEPLIEQCTQETYEAPEIWINPEVKNYYDFTIDDFKLINYQHGKVVPMEVAI